MRLRKYITPDRLVLIGAVVAGLAYLQDLRYDFILDDVPLILMNETLTSWGNWKKVFLTHIFAGETRVSTGTMAIHYRPIYRLWQMLNEQVFGSVIPWWHLTSLLLHLGATLLVYQLGIKLIKERWTAALAAVLFAVHPIHAESVAYVTASSDLLVVIFALVSFLAYFHFREEGASRLYFAASVLAASLAMLSKETAVVFPWTLVAYEALRKNEPDTERSWKRYLWTLPYFAVVGAYLAVRTVLFGLNSGPGPKGDRLAALLNMPLVLVVYLRNLFWPFRLSFFYPGEWGSEWTVLRAAAALLAVAAAVFLWKRYGERSGIRLQILWTAILFAPALLSVYALVREDWVHDRHMYWVSVPVCLLVAAVITDPQWHGKAPVIASCVIAAILAVSLALNVPRFTDNSVIYETALKVAPRSLLLHTYYGSALLAYGHKKEGLREYEITTELAPQSPETHEWYAGTLAYVGRYDEAKAEYAKALELSEHSTVFHAYVFTRLAMLELKLSEYPQAEANLREAVRLEPETPDYHVLLAEALALEGQTKEAQEAMQVEASIKQKEAQRRPASRE